LTPIQSPSATSRPAADLFDARTYTDWARAAARLREGDAGPAILFDSTTSEPTAELARVARETFGEPVSDRFVSVFADGNPFARRALAARYGLPEDHFLMTTGATSALRLVMEALVTPGDEVLVERPGFDVLAQRAIAAGAKVRPFVRRAPDFRLDLAELRDALTPSTRAVLITNLHNPSGAWLSPHEITAAARILEAAGVVLVVDEVYVDYAAEAGAPPAARLGPNIVTLSSLTKVFGLFSLKFGWLAAQGELLARIRARAPDGDYGTSKLAHAVAAKVLEQPAPFEAHWRAGLDAARPMVSLFAERMRAAGVLEGEVPPYGCMYFPRIAGVDDTLDLARWLFREHDVLVAPGEYFGAPGHLRIGFGGDEEALARGLLRLETALVGRR
jgi:aspartate/methionine/tyrosine aminotransferase